MLRKVSVVAAALLMLANTAAAQMVEDYRFKGQVKSTEGKGVAGARITLRNVENGKLIVIEPDEQGKFDKRMIPHAVYEASFEATGYAPQQQQLDWSAWGEKTIVREAEIILVSDKEIAKRERAAAEQELGAKKGKLYRKAYDALNAGNCSEASSNANELLELGAGSFEHAARFVVARCLATAGRLAEAAQAYRRVVELKPELFEARFDLGKVLQQEGDTSGAVEQLEVAARLNPTHVDTHYSIGAMLFLSGKYAQARPSLERTVELAPEHADAHKALGMICLSGEDKDFGLAKQHLQRYLELAPEAADREQFQAIVKDL